MAFFPALIQIREPGTGDYFVYRRLGGQPTLIVPVLQQAFAVGRRGVTSAHFAARICAAIGINSIRETMLFPEDPGATIRFLYEISLPARSRIRVSEISDAGEPRLIYDGFLEAYLTKELRRRRRGPKPAGFASKEEFHAWTPERHPNLKREILEDREQSPNPYINLEGVRVLSKEEYLVKRQTQRRKKK